jgi:transposase
MESVTDALATLDLSSLPSNVRDVLLAQQATIRAEREAREQENAAHAAVREARAILEDQNAELSAYNARLEYLVKEFHQALYAKRSEKLNPDQLDLLFEDLEAAIAQTRAEAETRDPAKRREPAQRNIGRLPEHLPQIERVIAPASTLCPCGCGEMAKIGEDRTKRLDIIPAQFRVIVTVRPKYACRTCEAGVVQALAPAHLIEGGLPTEALIAHVLVGKYADHLPLYRQAQIYARSGVDLDRSTPAAWVGKAGFHLAPLVDRLAERLKQSKTVFMDETRAPVLDPGRGRTKTGLTCPGDVRTMAARATVQRRNGTTFATSRKAAIPSSATVRRNSSFAASSVGNRSSHTVEVPAAFTTSSVHIDSVSSRQIRKSTATPSWFSRRDKPEVTILGSRSAISRSSVLTC